MVKTCLSSPVLETNRAAGSVPIPPAQHFVTGKRSHGSLLNHPQEGLQALLVLVGSGLALSHLPCRAESTPRRPEGGCWVTRLCHLTPNTAQSQAPGCKPRIFQFGAFLGQTEWVSHPPRLADRQSQESCLVGGVSDSLGGARGFRFPPGATEGVRASQGPQTQGAPFMLPDFCLYGGLFMLGVVRQDKKDSS